MRLWQRIACGFHFTVFLLENKLSEFLFKSIRFNSLKAQQQPFAPLPIPPPKTRRKVFIGGGVDGNLHLTSSAINWVTSAKAV